MATASRVRLAELLGSLSLATDVGTGQPLGHGLRTCLLAIPVAAELGCDDDEIRSVQQVSLLRFVGCTAEASVLAETVGGDERSFNAAMSQVINGTSGEAMKAMFGSVGKGKTPLTRARLLVGAVADKEGSDNMLTAHCEVAAMLASRLGLEANVIHALANAYERWDGKGAPLGLQGEAVPLEIRIAAVARDVDLAVQAGEDAEALLRRRRGKAYDPRVVDAFERLAIDSAEADWDALLAAEPEPFVLADLEDALEVMADFVDLKSPWTRGHSRKVAGLAHAAAREAGMTLDEAARLRRAGLVHDLGRVGVENGVWDKRGVLALDEWEKVKLHPYLTHRILSRCEALRSLADLASRHHERLDGSGYHRQLGRDGMTPADRILAAADVLVALTSDRPHREAYGLEEAGEMVIAEAGRLDPDAAAWVVSAAGGEAAPPAVENPDSLTDRELEVLGLIASEFTNKQMAERLYISPKTVGRHVENIYAKIGVSTRAGAAVYAMERHLVG